MNPVDPELQDRIAAADRALAQGRLHEARSLLEDAAASDPDSMAFWHRLATVRRLSGAPGLAMTAIERALTLAPLDFISLMMRAGLLDQANHPEAGEAYGRALAQRRPDPLPSAMTAAVARAEAVWSAHQERLEFLLCEAVEQRGIDLTPTERVRAARLASNITHRTRIYHSEATHFHYPGLREIEYHDRAQFPWLEELEAATDAVSLELEAAMASRAADLRPYIRYADSEPMAQWKPLNNNRDWTAIHLIERGSAVEANSALCPATMALLDRFPQPWIDGCGANAMFSMLAPRTAIPAHVGVANFRLVCHLPLIVPNRCWFRVGEEVRDWERGTAWVFDDTIEHEARNETDHLRVILIFDVWHPDLSPAEREAIAATVGAAAMPIGAL
jgi:aspartyl/asparaginyl beta-hydroxylase (cupin superfamily)